ncbi:MAG TPA: hypothetical protein P5050_11835, partial [Bacteroidia bacterium]|nr:hypothetical protein [Bacteroidia bacterium]
MVIFTLSLNMLFAQTYNSSGLKKSICFFFFLVFFSEFLLAQKEASHWYFGWQAGLFFDIDNDTVIADTTGKSSGFACASISDKNGNLLFYTNGDDVWDSDHKLMKNGKSVSHPDRSAFNKYSIICLIVPNPLRKNIFYIFSINIIDECALCYKNSNLYYSIVDMNKNNGKGDVISKNNLLLNDVSYKLTAVKHSNNKAIWVITHTVDSKDFYSFLVDANGININPVISSTGSTHKIVNVGVNWKYGDLKVSPDGNKLVCLKSCDTLPLWAQINFEVFNFNPNNGKINLINKYLIHLPQHCEFSPNGRYLYLEQGSNIYQYDWEKVFDSIDFLNSRILIEKQSKGWGSLQTGIDGKIYRTKHSNSLYYLGVIQNPNKKGLHCNYNDSGVYLLGKVVGPSLPIFIQSYFFIPDFEAKNTCLSDTTLFYITDTSRIDSVLWDFGDSASGLNNFSTLWRPKHFFA